MKTKLISILLLLSVAITLLFSCGGNEAVYYGAVEKDSQSGIMCINIPSLGLCQIPEAENIYSEFSGKKVKNYTLKEGDLVRLTFSDADKIAIMEIHPARFNLTADEIVAYAEGISIEYESYPGRNPLCRITCNATGALANLNAGDYVAFCLGKNTDTNVYCYAEVYTVRDNGKVTLQIELSEGVSVSDLLAKFPEEFNFIVY